MFDDHVSSVQPPKGQVPDNLPIGEPEDIFATPDHGSHVDPASTMAVPDIPSAPSALSAGVLRPVQSDVVPAPATVRPDPVPPPRITVPPQQDTSEANDLFVPPPVSASSQDVPYKIQSPSLAKNILIVFGILLGVGGVIAGGWWAYRSFIPTQGGGSLPVGTTSSSDTGTIDTDTLPGNNEDSQQSSTISVDDSVLFGDVVDSDQDGLDDFREKDLGTNIDNADTDEDALTDYEEVAVWKTDPLRQDTDGDSYADGEEVKNGYNPGGPGRIFQPPTSTASIVPNASAVSARSSVSSVTLSTTTPQLSRLVGDANCGSDIHCFLAKATTCQKAGVQYTGITDLRDALGVNRVTLLYAEMQGKNPQNECQLYVRVEQVALSFTNTVPSDVQNEQRVAAQEKQGKDGVCLFEMPALSDMLQEWSTGVFAESDFVNGQCTGSLFES